MGKRVLLRVGSQGELVRPRHEPSRETVSDDWPLSGHAYSCPGGTPFSAIRAAARIRFVGAAVLFETDGSIDALKCFERCFVFAASSEC